MLTILNMGKWFTTDTGIFLTKLLFILLTLTLLRAVFFGTNYFYFSDVTGLIILKTFFYSVRIDIAALLLINGFLLLFLSLFPLLAHQRRKTLDIIFILVNGALLFLTVCDNMFFSYTQRRLTYDLLFLIPHSFTLPLLWLYCKEGWYWLLLLAAFFLFFRKAFGNQKDSRQPGWQSGKTRIFTSACILIICSIAVRGLKNRPLSPSTALLYFPSKMVNLSANTAFNLFYSYYKGEKQLTVKNYFSQEELDKRFPIFFQGTPKSLGNKPNIILFVMESFARDYLDSSSKFKSLTPFLDSLMRNSLVFTHAFNNGRQSTHGLVAVLASLPPFLQTPYYHSQYQAVSFNGLGKMLRETGYDGNFFLGDVDNSFGFREFTHSIGIEHYYSRKDFDDDRFFNGTWGIHDENFFRYAADILKNKRQPFFATIFNVSSHPPFNIPEKHRRRFDIPHQNAAQNSVSYVDYAYETFFEHIKNKHWFANTIFIFVADHFYNPSASKLLTAVNSNAIPFFIYAPGMPSLQGNRNYVVQQLDVVPTILDLTGYQGRYMSFGNSVLSSRQPRYAVQRMDYVNQIMDSSYVLGLNIETDAITYLYNYRSDPGLLINLLADPAVAMKKLELENQLKAMIQRFNSSIINNRLIY